MSTPAPKRSLFERVTRNAVLFVLVTVGAFGGAWLGFVTVLEQLGGALGLILAIAFGLPVGFFGGMIAGLLAYGLVAAVWWAVRPRRERKRDAAGGGKEAG